MTSLSTVVKQCFSRLNSSEGVCARKDDPTAVIPLSVVDRSVGYSPATPAHPLTRTDRSTMTEHRADTTADRPLSLHHPDDRYGEVPAVPLLLTRPATATAPGFLGTPALGRDRVRAQEGAVTV